MDYLLVGPQIKKGAEDVVRYILGSFLRVALTLHPKSAIFVSEQDLQ